MSPIDDEIRVLLRSKAAEAPVRDEPPPIVLRRTRLMRGVNAVTAVAASAAVVLGIVLGAQSLGSRRMPFVGPERNVEDVVPWSTMPAQGTIERSAAVGGKTGQACRALEVLPVVLDAPEGIGFDAHGRNVSCLIDPHATFGVVVRGKDLEPLPVQVRVDDSVPAIYVDSRRNETVALLFTWSNYCGPRSGEVVFDISLHSSMVRIQSLGRLLPPCTDPAVPSVLSFDAGGVLEPRPIPNLLNVSLTWDIDWPDQALRGKTLSFTVSIENKTDRAVSLDPCPDYVLGMRNDKDLISASYRLNCDDVRQRSIPPGERVSFEMRVYVPSFLEPGKWTMFWFLVPGGEESIEFIREISVV